MKEERKPEYPEKTPGDELQKHINKTWAEGGGGGGLKEKHVQFQYSFRQLEYSHFQVNVQLAN